MRLDASEGGALVCKKHYASEAMSMSDQDDWEFAGPDDAKAEIRAAVGYLLRGAIGAARGDRAGDHCHRAPGRERVTTLHC